jgi:aryl carrier-like protein
MACALGQHVIVARMAGEPFGALETATPTEAVPASAVLDSPTVVTTESADSLKQRLQDAPSGDRLAILRDLVRERVVRILRLDSADLLGRYDRLMDVGLDSLMAVQLRNQLTEALGLDRPLPASLMFDHSTIEALAEHLLSRMMPADTDATLAGVRASAAVVGRRAADVSAMTDAEVEALLLERLEKQ